VKRIRLFLPAIAAMALLVMSCSVCGNLGQIRSGLSEISEQATALATVLPDEEALRGTVEAQLTQVTQEDVPIEAIEEIPTEATGDDMVEPGAEETEGPSAEDMTEDEVQESLDLNMSQAALEGFNSYRTETTVRWEGTDNGEPASGALTIKYASVREPPAMQMEMSGNDFGAGHGDEMSNVSFIQVGDTAWFYESESDSWMQVPSGDFGFEEGFFFTPEDFLSEFEPNSGKRSPFPQDVNGVSCYKYSFDEKDFAEMDPSEGEVTYAKGEAFVAVDGGYVVKLTMEMEMQSADDQAEVFDNGTMWLDYNLTDVNQPITIEPPAEAMDQTQGREDIPQLPDAQQISAMDNFIMYSTDRSVSEAAEFYEREMPASGWQSEGDSMVMEDAAFLNFTKDGATASIIISFDEMEGTNVIVSVE
jgi:hypothetical protein